MFRTPLMIAVAVVVFVIPAAAQECGFDWVNPLPPRSDLFRVFERSGLYIAVGAEGTVATSANGVYWFVQRSGTDADLFGVDWGEGFFTVVGDGIVLSSRDGVNWTIVATPQSMVLADVDYGSGRFVAVGADHDGRVLISENGLHWIVHDTGWPEIGKSIVWTGERFVVSGDEDIFSSEDGLSWDYVGTVPRLKRVRKQDSDRAASLDELDRVDLEWDGSQFIWGGGREVFVSETGDQWEFRAELEGCDYFTTIFGVKAYGDIVMVTGASACPDPFINPDAVILVSTDGGKRWGTVYQQPGGGFTSVIEGRLGYVAVGSLGDFVTSNNALSWFCSDGSCSSEACSDALFDIAVAPLGHVAVGGAGACDLPGKGSRENAKRLEGGTVLRSADGKIWTPYEVSTSPLFGVVHHGSIYVAVGKDVTATSSDGVVWTERAFQAPPAILKSITWGAGTFVSVGTGGTILASTGGVNWGKQYSFTENDLERVFYDGNTFYVVGARGTFLTSIDGMNWNVPTCVCRGDLHGVVSTGSEVYVVGDRGGVWSSDDLETWTPQFAGSRGTLRDIAWSGEYFVAVGYEELSDGSRPALVTMSADGVHWSILNSQGRELNRIVYSGSEFLATGMGRSLVRSECSGMLVTFDPPKTEFGWSETLELTLTLSENTINEVFLNVVSSMPGAAQTAEIVRIPPGRDQVIVEVEGIGIGKGILITATLPKELGGAAAVAEIEVVPPLPNPRRPRGRYRTP